MKLLNAGVSDIDDIANKTLQKAIKESRFTATTDPKLLSQMDTVSVCVPTPLSKTKDPDVSYILSALESIRPHLKKGSLVVYANTINRTEENDIGEEVKLHIPFMKCYTVYTDRVEPGILPHDDGDLLGVLFGYFCWGNLRGKCLYLGSSFFGTHIFCNTFLSWFPGRKKMTLKKALSELIKK